MDDRKVIATLSLIADDIQREKLDAERKNNIRKCDIHQVRIDLCNRKLAALDRAIEVLS